MTKLISQNLKSYINFYRYFLKNFLVKEDQIQYNMNFLIKISNQYI